MLSLHVEESSPNQATLQVKMGTLRVSYTVDKALNLIIHNFTPNQSVTEYVEILKFKIQGTEVWTKLFDKRVHDAFSEIVVIDRGIPNARLGYGVGTIEDQLHRLSKEMEWKKASRNIRCLLLHTHPEQCAKADFHRFLDGEIKLFNTSKAKIDARLSELFVSINESGDVVRTTLNEGANSEQVDAFFVSELPNYGITEDEWQSHKMHLEHLNFWKAQA